MSMYELQFGLSVIQFIFCHFISHRLGDPVIFLQLINSIVTEISNILKFSPFVYSTVQYLHKVVHENA